MLGVVGKFLHSDVQIAYDIAFNIIIYCASKYSFGVSLKKMQLMIV